MSKAERHHVHIMDAVVTLCRESAQTAPYERNALCAHAAVVFGKLALLCDSVSKTFRNIEDGSGLTIPCPPVSLNGGANADEIASYKSGYLVKTVRIITITLKDVVELKNSMVVMSNVEEEWRRDGPHMRQENVEEGRRRLLKIMQPVMRFFDVDESSSMKSGVRVKIEKANVQLRFNEKSDIASPHSFGVCVCLSKDVLNGNAPVAAFKWFGLDRSCVADSTTYRTYSMRFGDVQKGEDMLRMEPDDSDDDEDGEAVIASSLASFELTSSSSMKKKGDNADDIKGTTPSKGHTLSKTVETRHASRTSSEQSRRDELNRLAARARILMDNVNFKRAISKHPHSSSCSIERPLPPRSTSTKPLVVYTASNRK